MKGARKPSPAALQKRRRMFQRILVPVNFTPADRRALTAAGELAQAGGAAVTLIHVIEVLPRIGFKELQSFYGMLQDRALKKMTLMAGALSREGVRAAIEIPYGKRAEEIVRYAAEKKIDLIVLSSHQVDLRRPDRGLGTISYKVGILSRCPVLLLK
jgi:nucleotide-binding universal stress UspA family protein